MKGRFHIKFKDRTSAGEILASILTDFYKKQRNVAPIAVLAIPRGGVIVGDAIASKFKQGEFDIVIPRKLGAPNNPELAIGAVMQDRTAYLNENVIQMLQVPSEYIDGEIDSQVLEVKRRMSLYRDPSKPYNIAERSVVIVDDGADTGATITAAVKWIKRLQCTPKRLIVAIPVAPKNTVLQLEKECEAEVKVLVCPSPSLFCYVEK